MTEPILLDAVLLLAELTERLLTEPRTKALQAEARTTLKTLEALNLLPPTEEAEEVREILRQEMESVVKLSVPLCADISIGGNWNACK